MPYKTIFIDWDGTLSASRFWEHWAAEYPQKFAQIQLALFVQRPDLLNHWMIGQITAEICLAEVAAITHIEVIELLQGLEYSCQHMSFINDDSLTSIHQLRQKGVQVVIATDNMDTFHRWTTPALGLNTIFDHILNSAQLGTLKTTKDLDGTSLFFGKYLLHHHLKPGDTILIDDSPGNSIVQDFGIDYLKIDHGQDITSILNNLK
jgi:FMN phosphatase YigB (HAD superfamily)